MWLQIRLQDGAKKDSSGQGVMRAIISPLCFPISHLEDRAKLPPPSILECLCRQAISLSHPLSGSLSNAQTCQHPIVALHLCRFLHLFDARVKVRDSPLALESHKASSLSLFFTPQESEAWQLGSRSWKLLVCSTWLDRMMEWTFGNSNVL